MSFHNNNYQEYLKQFNEVQHDVKKNIRRYDLGLQNQAITTGPMGVHKLRGGASSSQDIYRMNQELFKKRSQDLEAISLGTFTTSYKGETPVDLVSNSGQELTNKIQKLEFSITSGNSSSQLLTDLFEIISFIQKNGYLLREEEITESINNLDDILKLLDVELSNPSLSDSKFIVTKSTRAIVSRIIQLLKNVLKYVDKPIAQRKSVQASVNKTINFKAFFAKVKRAMEHTIASGDTRSRVTGFTGVTLGKHSSEMPGYTPSMYEAFAPPEGIEASAGNFKVGENEFPLDFESFMINIINAGSPAEEIENIKSLMTTYDLGKQPFKLKHPPIKTSNPKLIRGYAGEVFNALRTKAKLPVIDIPEEPMPGLD